MPIANIFWKGFKTLLLIAVTAIFSLYTLVTMPNQLNAGRSLVAMYNFYLQEDTNMDVIEFIGEKLLLAGIDPTEQQENQTPNNHPFLPLPNTSSIGFTVLFYTPETTTPIVSQPLLQKSFTVINGTYILPYGYTGSIFHPPLTSVA